MCIQERIQRRQPDPPNDFGFTQIIARLACIIYHTHRKMESDAFPSDLRKCQIGFLKAPMPRPPYALSAIGDFATINRVLHRADVFRRAECRRLDSFLMYDNYALKIPLLDDQKVKNTWRGNKVNGTIVRTLLQAAVSALALSASSAALSQEASLASPADVEESKDIVVTGLREGLEGAAMVKRKAPQVVDVITIGELGALPTTSIADALELTPGAVGTRFRGTIDAISLRGLPNLFSMSSVSGRVLSSGQGDRDLRTRIYPAQFFRQAQILKSPLASQVEGSIAGTINLTTPSPLDEKYSVRANVRGQYAPYNDNNSLISKFGGEGTALLTHKFKMDSGDLGVMLGGNYLNSPTVFANATVQSHTSRVLGGQSVLLPDNLFFANNTEAQTRRALMGIVEWRGDNGLSIKADAMYVAAENPQQLQSLNFISLSTVANYTASVIDSGRLVSASVRNSRARQTIEDLDRKDRTIYGGINASYSVDSWDITLDAYYSRTNASINNNRVILQSPSISFSFAPTDGQINFSNSSLDLSSRSIWGVNQHILNETKRQDVTNGLRFDVKRSFDGAFITSVEVGASYSGRTMYDRVRGYVDSTVSNATLYPAFAVGALSSDLFATTPYLNTSLHDSTPGTFPASIALFNREKLFAAMPAIPADYPQRDADKLASVDNHEKTYAGYAQAGFSGFAGRLNGTLGLRIVNTNLQSYGVTGQITAVTNSVGDVVIQASTLVPGSAVNSYTEFLPTLNVSYALADNLVLRGAVARTMARPSLRDLRFATQLTGGNAAAQPFSGAGGNPYLKPVTANQLDLSLEWYPKKGTSLSLGSYYKNVENFVVDDVRSENIGGYDFQISSPVNLDKGKFYGVEITARHDFFWLPPVLKGFGVYATATFNWADIDPAYGLLNNKNSSGNFVFAAYDRDPGVDGLAPVTISGILFYERGPFSVRGSASYAGDRIRRTGSENAPVVSLGRTIYTAAASLRLTKYVRLDAQVTDISQDDNRAYFVFREYTQLRETTGRRYFMGMNMQF